MGELQGRGLIEHRFGPLGSGADRLVIGEAEYDLFSLLAQVGVAFDDAKPIDALMVAEGHYVLRFLDAQDQRVVAYEFDTSFRRLGEIRAHLAEWLGDGAYYSEYSGH